MTIGKQLRKERQDKGLTIQDVVDMAGGAIDKTTVSRIENDERGLSLKAAVYFSLIYGLDLKELAKMELGKDAKIHKVKLEKKKRGRPSKKA